MAQAGNKTDKGPAFGFERAALDLELTDQGGSLSWPQLDSSAHWLQAPLFGSGLLFICGRLPG